MFYKTNRVRAAPLQRCVLLDLISIPALWPVARAPGLNKTNVTTVTDKCCFMAKLGNLGKVKLAPFNSMCVYFWTKHLNIQ